MTAALGTLPFIATLWLLAVLGAAVLEESGAKIAAALKGRPLQKPSVGEVSVRVRGRPLASRPMHVSVEWRAAA